MKLADIDPQAVANTIVRTVVEHLFSTAMRLDPTLILPIRDDAGVFGLRSTAHALALYAQRGIPVWDWTDHGMAADGLLEVVAALYSRAADGDLERTAIDVIDDVDPDDAVGLVLVAAAARVRLDREEGLTARELGALSGMTAFGVRHLTRSGELPTDGERPARVPAEAARRWLASRGVPGI